MSLKLFNLILLIAYIVLQMQEMKVDEQSKNEIYDKAEDYWNTVPATVDGMLGGFSHISSIDIEGSTLFIKDLFAELNVGRKRVVDCGAGIGRVSKLLLSVLFEEVDMVEQSQKFLDTALKYLEPDERKKIRKFICLPLQSFSPEGAEYDVIWCQWVLGHLTDSDLISLLKRCKLGINSNGVIVVKENVSKNDKDFDEHDHSWTRSREQFLHIFKQSDLEVLKDVAQSGFPEEIYEVRIFALR